MPIHAILVNISEFLASKGRTNIDNNCLLVLKERLFHDYMKLTLENIHNSEIQNFILINCLNRNTK